MKTFTFTNNSGATISIDLKMVANHCLVEDFIVPTGLKVLQITFTNDTNVLVEFSTVEEASYNYDNFYAALSQPVYNE
jgi:hypothetical protein